MIIKKNFCDISDMFDFIFSTDIKNSFAVVGKYNAVRGALKEILITDDMLPCDIELEDELWDGYDKEFILTTLDNDVFCERLFLNGAYLYFEDCVVFIMPGCSEECLRHIEHNSCAHIVYIVDFECSNLLDTDCKIGATCHIVDGINMDLVAKLNMDLIKDIIIPCGGDPNAYYKN